jgi:hypothetical protein
MSCRDNVVQKSCNVVEFLVSGMEAFGFKELPGGLLDDCKSFANLRLS